METKTFFFTKVHFIKAKKKIHFDTSSYRNQTSVDKRYGSKRTNIEELVGKNGKRPGIFKFKIDLNVYKGLRR